MLILSLCVLLSDRLLCIFFIVRSTLFWVHSSAHYVKVMNELVWGFDDLWIELIICTSTTHYLYDYYRRCRFERDYCWNFFSSFFHLFFYLSCGLLYWFIPTCDMKDDDFKKPIFSVFDEIECHSFQLFFRPKATFFSSFFRPNATLLFERLIGNWQRCLNLVLLKTNIEI